MTDRGTAESLIGYCIVIFVMMLLFYRYCNFQPIFSLRKSLKQASYFPKHGDTLESFQFCMVLNPPLLKSAELCLYFPLLMNSSIEETPP